MSVVEFKNREAITAERDAAVARAERAEKEVARLSVELAACAAAVGGPVPLKEYGHEYETTVQAVTRFAREAHEDRQCHAKWTALLRQNDHVEIARLREEGNQLRALLTAQPDAQWYVSECGDYDLVDSREEAERIAHELVEEYRRDAVADGEWPEDVDRIEVGYIVPVLRSVEESGPESGTSDWSMQPVKR